MPRASRSRQAATSAAVCPTPSCPPRLTTLLRYERQEAPGVVEQDGVKRLVLHPGGAQLRAEHGLGPPVERTLERSGAREIRRQQQLLGVASVEQRQDHLDPLVVGPDPLDRADPLEADPRAALRDLLDDLGLGIVEAA